MRVANAFDDRLSGRGRLSHRREEHPCRASRRSWPLAPRSGSPRSTCAPTNICCCSPGRRRSPASAACRAIPADSSLWRLGQRFPGNRGDLESALSTRPNLLITMGGGGKATALIAGKMGLRTLDLPFPATIQDVATQHDAGRARPGRRTPRPDRGSDALARLQQIAPPQRVTPSSSALAATASAPSRSRRNGCGSPGLKQRPLPGGRASLELLATRPPAVLLRSTYRRSERSLGQTWLDHPLASPKSSTNHHRRWPAWTCAGPLMLGEVERLQEPAVRLRCILPAARGGGAPPAAARAAA